VAKATYAIVQGSRLQLAEKQAKLELAGKHWGDPETSSLKFEPEVALTKPATDVVLIGHAWAPASGTGDLLVQFRVGAWSKSVRVFGDRVWSKSFGIAKVPKPQTFEKVPLIYERAFGGWDRTPENPERHKFEPRNPVGVGFHSKHGHWNDGAPLPNLEDPERPIHGWKDAPPPAGFGFIAPSWQPRAGYAGTYDAAWEKNRKPLLPADFDPRFFSAASPGLVASGFLAGNEAVVIDNASRDGRVAFDLPGVPPPHGRIQCTSGVVHDVQTRLDTVIVDTDANLVYLLWRGRQVLKSGPHDVAALGIEVPGAAPQAVVA
jgi:hypothetical protein